MRRGLIIFLIITLAIILSVYLPVSFYPLNKIILTAAGKRLDARISCRNMKIYIWRSIIAKEIEAVGNGGFSVKADKGVIDYDLASLVTGRLHLKCGLENAGFSRRSSIMNALTDLLDIEPIVTNAFHTVRGDFYVGYDDTITQDLVFLNDNVKIIVNAFTDTEDNIRGSLYLFLNDAVTGKIPKEVRAAILRKEDGPWSSIYVGIMGNYQRPALRIMTERFRMNIAAGRGY